MSTVLSFYSQWFTRSIRALSLFLFLVLSRLRPHQRRGVKFLFDCVCNLHNIRGNGAILADDMYGWLCSEQLVGDLTVWRLCRVCCDAGV